MKEPISEVNNDIDAGWDEIAPTTSPVSITVKSVDSQPPQVEELDAGWDEEPATAPFQTEKVRAPKGVAASSEPRSAPLTVSQVSLTRKAKKELERQAKHHEAQRKAEARAQRKERRRAKVTRMDDARRVAPNASKNDQPTPTQQRIQPRAKKKKPKPESRVHRPQVVEKHRVELESHRPEPVAIAEAATKIQHGAPAKSNVAMRVIVGLMVIALGAAIIRWLR